MSTAAEPDRVSDRHTFAQRLGVDTHVIGDVRDRAAALKRRPDATLEQIPRCHVAARLDFSRAHQLSGPFYVTGAEPGDLLEVELLDVSTEGFGVSIVTAEPGSMTASV